MVVRDGPNRRREARARAHDERRDRQRKLAVPLAIPVLVERVVEELDYQLEAASQRAFAEAYADDEDFLVPRVMAAAPRVIVTEWVEGIPLSKIIGSGTVAQRDRAGALMATLHFSAPERAGLLHADPHPGNYRLLPDGRLAVIDFGAVARLPQGLPEPVGRITRLALAGRADEAAVVRAIKELGRPGHGGRQATR